VWLALLFQQPSPLTPEQELASFTLARDFTVELVAAEPEAPKVVDLAFDDAGRMWAITATEYPLDGNESPAAAELYAKGGRDRVLVFDEPWKPGRQTPRVFADGLAMPMALLPIRGGLLLGQGPEILFLKDTDGDGRADTREVVLSGFGIQDSHLMPHRFVRGPNDWIFVAQGAFNSSQVRTKGGEVVPFEQCKLARFQPDGSRFEVVGHGLNNIWGFVLDRLGEMWVQEANDLGYPLARFYYDASYPGIGDHKHRPYSPWQPSAVDFQMGGTGLSGLALSQDRGRDAFMPPWNGEFFVANPIVNAIQTIRADAHYGKHERRPDLLTSTDPWFRPVAIHFGPDGCLYVVDWYNEIISHNEVPRGDPRRDKTRGRIWRIANAMHDVYAPPDVSRLPDAKLVETLSAEMTGVARAAWHQIVERKAVALAPALRKLAQDQRAEADARILALWSLEGLGALDLESLASLASSGPRWEAARAIADGSLAGAAVRPILAHLWEHASDARTRAETLRALGTLADEDFEYAARQLLACVAPALSLGTQGSFEVSLVRATLEDHPRELTAFLGSPASADLSLASRAFACLALPAGESAERLAQLLPELHRAPTSEELARLVDGAHLASVRAAFAVLLREPGLRSQILAQLYEVRARFEPPVVQTPGSDVEYGYSPLGGGFTDLLVDAARELLASPAADRDLFVRLVAGFRLRALAPETLAIARSETEPVARRRAALRALLEVGAPDAEVCHELALGALPGEEFQRLAVEGLRASRSARAPELLLDLWPSLPPALRKPTLVQIVTTPGGPGAILDALDEDLILPEEVLAAGYFGQFERENAADPRYQALAKLNLERMRRRSVPVLALVDGEADFADTDLALTGPFTLEAWVQLSAPITNTDALLGTAGGADVNFHERRARFYAGSELGDVLVARTPIEPDTWTHVALTRDASGALALYLDGELDVTGGPCTRDFTGLDVGRASASEPSERVLAPSGLLRIAELRLWNVARGAAEIGRDHRRRLDDSERPASLIARMPFPPRTRISGWAHMELGESEGPPLFTPEEARALDERFARVRALAQAGGDAAAGRVVLERTCLVCHTLTGAGGNIGPPLDGSGLRGVDGLLSAIVTPSAALESGYRQLRVETKGERLEGFLARSDESQIVLRRQGREDLVLPRTELLRAEFQRLSVMPEGLLDGLSETEVRDLFACLLALR